jgi:hypothetical protein
MEVRMLGDLVRSRLLYAKYRDLNVTGVGFDAPINRFMLVSGTNSLILRWCEVIFRKIEAEGLICAFGS